MNDHSNPSSADSGSTFPADMVQYLHVYIDESDEELEGLAQAILHLETDPQHAESLQRSFRMLHSLKGSSGMMGFEVAANLAHQLEDRFEAFRSGRALLDRETTTLVLDCIDYFRNFVRRLRSGNYSEENPEQLLARLRKSAQQVSADTPRPITPGSTSLSPAAMSITGGLKLVIHFRPGLQLADLKARLIISRLSSIGEILSCDPPIDESHSFDELPLFSLTLLTGHPLEHVLRIASVDGVTSIETPGNPTPPNTPAEPQFASPAESEALNLPAPTPTAGPPRSTESTPQSPHVSTGSATTTPVNAVSGITPLPAAPTREPDQDATETKNRTLETLRVEIDKLDDLMNLTGELVVANARFTQVTARMKNLFRHPSALRKYRNLTERLREQFQRSTQLLNNATSDSSRQWSQGLQEDLDELTRHQELWEEAHSCFTAINDAVDQLSRVSKNVQRSVLKTRMVPVGPLFNRFRRVIRDLAVGQQKHVQLSIQGEKTELDKRMIDALGDPLLHLVRNAIDHGLESTEQRLAAGKPEAGTIFLEAAHRGNHVLITIRDDGAGINTEKIRSRVVERGLASEQQVRDLTDQQVSEFIWHPGFSTAPSITEISGRGVGMDIVRNAIADLSGSIDLSFIPGQGTTFTVRLPLTLAIIHSLLIRYDDNCFSLPTEDVREIVSVPRSELHLIHRQLAVAVRGELVPLVNMGTLFQWNSTATPTRAAQVSNAVNVVILQTRGKTLGLAVDSLVGRADLVIKSLTENLYPVRGLSGASILGDGTVCLMLDAAALMELASERTQVANTM